MSEAAALSTSMSTEQLLELYRVMLRIRAFEDMADQASQGGTSAFGQATSAAPAPVRGPLHLSHGQEAVAVGVCASLHADDAITSTHRGHGHCIAKGADPWRMFAELLGRVDGYNAGKGGSMHIADFSVGMLGSNGVVAAGIPIAVGAAQAFKLRGESRIVACFFGDGAINRGPFLEGLNWAQVFQLPVLFVCEDNRYSATTRSADMTAGEGAAARARSLGIATEVCDGNDVIAVARAAAELASQVRAGGGPRLLHAITYRFKGHVSVDPASYRDPCELDRALEHDPIVLTERVLMERGCVASAHASEPDSRIGSESAARAAATGPGPREIASLDEIKRHVREQIDQAMQRALASPWPDAAAAFKDVQDGGVGVWR